MSMGSDPGGGIPGLGGPASLRSASSSFDDIKAQFMTREGLYKLMTLSEYSRPNRVSYTVPAPPGGTTGAPGNAAGTGGPPPVRVSFSREVGPKGVVSEQKIVFNYGREIFVFPYRGVKKVISINNNQDHSRETSHHRKGHKPSPKAHGGDNFPTLVAEMW